MPSFINGLNITSNVQPFTQFCVERSSDQNKPDRTQGTNVRKTDYQSTAIKISDKVQRKI